MEWTKVCGRCRVIIMQRGFHKERARTKPLHRVCDIVGGDGFHGKMDFNLICDPVNGENVV